VNIGEGTAFMFRALSAFVAALLLPLAGCTSSAGLPPTYPAGGSVEYKDGSPMKGGTVQFSTSSDPLLRVVGQVREDGTFTLNTIKDRSRAAGAPEGEYQVIVQPPLIGEHKGVIPITIPKPYKVEAKDNQFRIQLSVVPPRS
jgi:hypothetical protein